MVCLIGCPSKKLELFRPLHSMWRLERIQAFDHVFLSSCMVIISKGFMHGDSAVGRAESLPLP